MATLRRPKDESYFPDPSENQGYQPEYGDNGTDQGTGGGYNSYPTPSPPDASGGLDPELMKTQDYEWKYPKNTGTTDPGPSQGHGAETPELDDKDLEKVGGGKSDRATAYSYDNWSGSRTDPGYINHYINDWMQNSNPRGHTDPTYWNKRITETGGLGKDNLDYWKGRFMEPEGTHQEPGGGGGTPIDWSKFGSWGGPGDQGPYGGQNVNVGNDPFSQLLTNALGKLIQGGGAPQSKFGQEYQQSLKDLIANGGMNAGQLESVRAPYEKARKAGMANLHASLADRGLIGSGENANAIGRMEENLAVPFATALQQGASSAFNNAMNLAGTAAQNDQSSLLQGIGLGNQRQAMLADIALRNLDQNRLWNQFLAEFGLKRDQVMAELQQGNLAGIMGLLQMFLQKAGMKNAGYV